MNLVNYDDVLIPNVDQLMDEFRNSERKLDSIPKYRFTDLFFQHPNGNHTKNRNVMDQIGLNIKLNKRSPALNEVMGLYIFYENSSPIYVGISRAVLRRLKNHFLGRTHNQASLAYLIAREKYDNQFNIYTGTRSQFPFENYREEIQGNMYLNWEIMILPFKESYKMYFAEFYYSCKLKTYWNNFKTH